MEGRDGSLDLLSSSLLLGDCEDTEEGAPLSHGKSTSALLVKFFISEAGSNAPLHRARSEACGIGVVTGGVKLEASDCLEALG